MLTLRLHFASSLSTSENSEKTLLISPELSPPYKTRQTRQIATITLNPKDKPLSGSAKLPDKYPTKPARNPTNGTSCKGIRLRLSWGRLGSGVLALAAFAASCDVELQLALTDRNRINTSVVAAVIRHVERFYYPRKNSNVDD